MKKFAHIVSILILCIIAKCGYTQNLVPNYSFEVDTACPHSGGETSFAFPWIDPTNATSDYFNSCSAPGNYGVPLNGAGNRNALDGNAYAGFTAYSDAPLVNFREYIQVKLTDTLTASKCYKLIYYVSVADIALYGVNKLSAYFSPTAIGCSVCFLAYSPQVNFYTPTVIDNGTGWYKIEGTFQAHGDEQYMTIGNFNTDSNTIVTTVNPGMTNTIAYYYIDSVSLVQVTCPIDIGINKNTKPNPLFNLSPNPSNGNMILNYSTKSSDQAEMRVYDITGELISNNSLNMSSNQMIINEEQLNNGVYFYQIIVNDRLVQANKLIIIR